MPRPRFSSTGPKEKLSITMDPDLYKWLSARCGPGKEFSSISHGIERGITLLRDRDERRK